MRWNDQWRGEIKKKKVKKKKPEVSVANAQQEWKTEISPSSERIPTTGSKNNPSTASFALTRATVQRCIKPMLDVNSISNSVEQCLYTLSPAIPTFVSTPPPSRTLHGMMKNPTPFSQRRKTDSRFAKLHNRILFHILPRSYCGSSRYSDGRKRYLWTWCLYFFSFFLQGWKYRRLFIKFRRKFSSYVARVVI